MSIRPIEFNGMVPRSQDVGTLKQNEDNRPMFDQQNLAVRHEEEVQHNLQQVRQGEDAENYQKKYDAKEKGSNEYVMNRKKGKKKAGKEDEATAPRPSFGGFDIKV